jgi:hypothetical protein
MILRGGGTETTVIYVSAFGTPRANSFDDRRLSGRTCLGERCFIDFEPGRDTAEHFGRRVTHLTKALVRSREAAALGTPHQPSQRARPYPLAGTKPEPPRFRAKAPRRRVVSPSSSFAIFVGATDYN